MQSVGKGSNTYATCWANNDNEGGVFFIAGLLRSLSMLTYINTLSECNISQTYLNTESLVPIIEHALENSVM